MNQTWFCQCTFGSRVRGVLIHLEFVGIIFIGRTDGGRRVIYTWRRFAIIGPQSLVADMLKKFMQLFLGTIYLPVADVVYGMALKEETDRQTWWIDPSPLERGCFEPSQRSVVPLAMLFWLGKKKRIPLLPSSDLAFKSGELLSPSTLVHVLNGLTFSNFHLATTLSHLWLNIHSQGFVNFPWKLFILVVDILSTCHWWFFSVL